MNCRACGFANPLGQRFCGGCGQPLLPASAAAASTSGPAADGERRQLTVLMCDVVGSTALSQALDPEDLRELLAAYQKVCGDAVRRHDGHIAQYLGDGVLIYFGYPQAHEDDARRAVRCGLEILSGMAGLHRSALLPAGTRLQVRAGAHTGRVVVGSVGSGARQESLALGDTPNIAARVQAMADPSTLTVSDTTWRIVHGYFRGVSRGEHDLKGVAHPMHLWCVTGSSGAESRLEGGGELTAYVGRGGEQQALAGRWARALAGESSFVTLQGEAGIGKSRLVGEFRQQLPPDQIDVLELRCTPYAQNSAFLPVIELMERRLGLDRSLPAATRLDRIDQRMTELGLAPASASPLLAALLSIPDDGRYPALDISPVRQRVRTLETLVAALQALPTRQPTLLIAEDLHWADPSTLELLQMLVAAAPRLPLLGLFTARPEFQPAWVEGGAATLLKLGHLQAAEVEAVVRNVARGKTVPGEVMREIARRCDGVPLFIEEVARSVIEAGVLEEREYSWELTGPLPVNLVPASVDASLMARIDRLGEARATAQLAATLGREFAYELLRAVSERSDEDLAADLARMVEAGLAWETDVGGVRSYVFKHALLQVAAYESLLRSTRQRFHERIAQVLRSDFQAEAQRRPETVARHLSGAGQHAQASDDWFAAGQAALARMAIPEAHGHFARALEGLRKLPETPETLSKELELQIAIAPTLMTVHGWAAPTVAQACERARLLCVQLGRPDRLYPPLWGLWTNLFVGGQLDRALVTADEALAMAQASGVPMLEVTGRHAVAYSRYYRGEWTQAIEHARAGITLYDVAQERALTSTFQLSSTVNLVAALGSSLWMLGHQDSGMAELDRMVAMARDVNHPSALSNALGVACYMGIMHRDAARLLPSATEVKSFARDEGWELWYAVGVMSSGWARLRLGDRGDGLKELLEGVALFRATRSDLMGPTVAVIHAEGLCAAGRRAEALQMLAETVATAQRGHVGVLLPEVHRLIGEIHFEAGALDLADAAYAQALACAQAQQALSLALRAALAWQPLLARRGRGDEGLALLRQQLEQFTDSHDQPDLVRARALLEAAAAAAD